MTGEAGPGSGEPGPSSVPATERGIVPPWILERIENPGELVELVMSREQARWIVVALLERAKMHGIDRQIDLSRLAISLHDLLGPEDTS